GGAFKLDSLERHLFAALFVDQGEEFESSGRRAVVEIVAEIDRNGTAAEAKFLSVLDEFGRCEGPYRAAVSAKADARLDLEWGGALLAIEPHLGRGRRNQRSLAMCQHGLEVARLKRAERKRTMLQV